MSLNGIVEKVSKGLPGVTINFGDVAAAADPDFCVENYKEMVLQIKRYIEDKEYYIKMSKKAKERVEQLTNSKAAMEEISGSAAAATSPKLIVTPGNPLEKDSAKEKPPPIR